MTRNKKKFLIKPIATKGLEVCGEKKERKKEKKRRGASIKRLEPLGIKIQIEVKNKSKSFRTNI